MEIKELTNDEIVVVSAQLPELGLMFSGCPEDCSYDECGCGGSDQY